jgi:acetyl esterase
VAINIWPSRSECIDAPLLSSSDVDCYHALYLRGTATRAYAMPLLATDFSGLPAGIDRRGAVRSAAR